MTALADQVSRRLLHRYQGATPIVTVTEILAAAAAAATLVGAAITCYRMMRNSDHLPHAGRDRLAQPHPARVADRHGPR